MITIAEATAEAVRLALLRHWCRQVADRRPPHDDVSDEAAALAGELARTLTVLELLRGTHRDTRILTGRARNLTERLAVIGLALPG